LLLAVDRKQMSIAWFFIQSIGEIPLVPTAPAVANAVKDAVGIRIKKLPITLERVLGFVD